MALTPKDATRLREQVHRTIAAHKDYLLAEDGGHDESITYAQAQYNAHMTVLNATIDELEGDPDELMNTLTRPCQHDSETVRLVEETAKVLTAMSSVIATLERQNEVLLGLLRDRGAWVLK